METKRKTVVASVMVMAAACGLTAASLSGCATIIHGAHQGRRNLQRSDRGVRHHRQRGWRRRHAAMESGLNDRSGVRWMDPGRSGHLEGCSDAAAVVAWALGRA